MILKIYFISGNANKAREIEEILNGDSLVDKKFILENLDYAIDEIQGTAEEIAKKKCITASNYNINYIPNNTSEILLVEDSALYLGKLNGMPGPYIKDFMDKMSAASIAKLCADTSAATAGCIFAAHFYNDGIKLFSGETAGNIVVPRGSEYFGWDCIFQPSGYTQTFAEMAPELKNKLSPRYRALMKLKEYLLENYK